LSDGFEVEVLGIEQSLRVADGRARDGDVHAAVCLVSRIKERYLGVVVPDIQPHEVRRSAAGLAFSLEIRFNFFAACLVEIPEIHMRTKPKG